MGRGRQRARAIASTNGSFCRRERGSKEPQEKRNQYCLLPHRHWRKSHLGKVGTCRMQAPLKSRLSLCLPLASFPCCLMEKWVCSRDAAQVLCTRAPCTHDTPAPGSICPHQVQLSSAVFQTVCGRVWWGCFIKHRAFLPEGMGRRWKANR